MGLKTDSICVQGGWQPKNGEPRMLPIYQSTTYRYETSEDLSAGRRSRGDAHILRAGCDADRRD